MTRYSDDTKKGKARLQCGDKNKGLTLWTRTSMASLLFLKLFFPAVRVLCSALRAVLKQSRTWTINPNPSGCLCGALPRFACLTLLTPDLVNRLLLAWIYVAIYYSVCECSLRSPIVLGLAPATSGLL